MVDRRTHEVKWYEANGIFGPTHFFNAHETGDKVVIDLHRIAKLGNPVGSNTPLSSHEWFTPAIPSQWRVNVRTGKVTDRMVSGIAGEFPKINDAFTGLANPYGYFVSTRSLGPATMTDGLARHDYLLDSTLIVEGPDGLTNPSEPVFVQREGGVAEDDGFILSIWWNRNTQLSELLFHDAANLTRTPLENSIETLRSIAIE